MAFKFVALLACVAYANAGLLAAPAVGYATYGAPQLPTITSQSQNILRSPGNLAQVSTYSKTIDTPFSSVSKSDVRVSNPGYVSAAYAPVAHATYAAPVAAYAAAPVAHATYAAAPVAYTKTYAAPVVAKTYAAPAVHTYQPGPAVAATYAAPVAHAAYAAPVAHAAYAAPVAHAAYAAPVAHAAYAAPVSQAHGLLGVAYSAAPAVAHVEYHATGLNYAF